MSYVNIEIKAHASNPEEIRNILKSKKAEFKGTDHQIDTYFRVNSGRLKLREGNIENNLIYYKRENKSGPKQSEVILFQNDPKKNIKEILTAALGILIEVNKEREIYFIDNVKFHIDNVKSLGTFIEIEAIDKQESIGRERLLEQCNEFIKLFNIQEKDLLSKSYSDMLLEK